MVVLGATVLASGTAYAYWATTGTGSGPAKATNRLPALITTAASPSGLRYPSGPKTALVVKIHNPGTLEVLVTGVTIDSSQPITSTGAGRTCTVTGITLDPSVTTIDLMPGATVSTTIASVVSMSTAADNGCQGATFAIPVLLSGKNL